MPTTVSLTALTVTDQAASHLNDTAKTKYTFSVLLPYLNTALNELQEIFQLNDIPVTDETSTVIQVDANVDEVGFSPTVPVPGTPYLPDDLIEPQQLWERERDVDPYIPMTKLNVLPQQLQGAQINQLVFYVWATNKLKFLPANADNDIKMDYIRRLFTPITASGDSIAVINAQTFLEFRTAGLAAEEIMQDYTRADRLNSNAGTALDRSLGIPTKGRQNISTRRRPFRAGWKSRTFG